MTDNRTIMARFAEIMRLMEQWLVSDQSAELLLDKVAVKALLEAERLRDWEPNDLRNQLAIAERQIAYLVQK